MTRQPSPAVRDADRDDDAFLTNPSAACVGTDPDLFFHDGHCLTARDICGRCPLVDPCREYAVARPWLAGVWGGTSGKERDRIRRERREIGS